MNKLDIELENCYGIQKLQCKFDFSQKNAVVLYAPNGMMKSSFARTFKAIENQKEPEELVSGATSSYQINIDDSNDKILAENIMVINPFDENASNNQGLLMANVDLREKYVIIHRTIDEQTDNLFSQIKEQFGYGSRSSFDAKGAFYNDFKTTSKGLLHELHTICTDIDNPIYDISLQIDDISYNDLFNEKVIKFVTKGKNPSLLDEYTQKYEELLEQSKYLKKGIIDHNNYNNIATSLSSNGFFQAENKVILQAKDKSQYEINTKEELEKLIIEEKEKVLNTKELKDLFEKINKELTANKDTVAFGTYIQNHPEIIDEYTNVEQFKKKVWICVIRKYRGELEELISCYQKAKDQLKDLAGEAKRQKTDWNKAIELFKNRFYVPFKIEPSNQEDVILKNDVPTLKFIFENGEGNIPIEKEKLLDVLSTGEKRAYYILNFIFEILVRQKEGRETLLILDDISESFDYKNKYAIIEYISDIMQYTGSANERLFKIILLTHNFDFYRTVSSRLVNRKNSFIAYKDDYQIKLKSGQYTKNIFKYFKEQIRTNRKFVVASIPFVRNLIEYAYGEENADYLILTNLLHYKLSTPNITIKNVEDIFNCYWCSDAKVDLVRDQPEIRVVDIIKEEADSISDTETLEIEDKIVVSMGIRLEAERYMIREIKEKVNGGEEIIENIYAGNNQTGLLLRKYKDNIACLDEDKLVTLEQVAMMTPENIHLNSFMFEPILDMSLYHLVSLYRSVKEF